MVNAISDGGAAYSSAVLGRKRYGDVASNNQNGNSDTTPQRVDQLVLGNNTPLSAQDKANLVVERALAKLKAVVGDARKELGLPEDAQVDTSPDATAGRITDFALGFFDNYAKKHGLQNDEAGRKAFADFIGGAINKGIDEARGILSSLSALDGNTSSNIDKTSDIIKQKLDDFVVFEP